MVCLVTVGMGTVTVIYHGDVQFTNYRGFTVVKIPW